MSAQHVTFFFPYPEDLGALESLDLDDPRFWSAEWRERRRAWSLRTFLMLQRAGLDVSISQEVPAHGTVVVGPELLMRKEFVRRSPRRGRAFVVGVRADMPRFVLADAEVVQNGKYADERRIFHVPHWPQPGLVPRDPARGNRVENIAFKGYTKNLHRAFTTPEWRAFLDANGFRFQVGAESAKQRDGFIPWHDYSDADLVLAVRPDFDDPYFDKPASKLFNAWNAGAPALLGPEHAYRELRQSSLDFVEVRSLEDVMAAVLRLRDEPDYYQAMIRNGFERARSFSPEAVRDRWAEVLFERVPALASGKVYAFSRNLPLAARRAANLVQRPPAASEVEFVRRWMGEIVRWQLNGRLRPWLGRVRQRVLGGAS